MRVAKAALIFVGIAAIILAIVGLVYNFASLCADFSSLLQKNEVPYFYPAFYAMSVICIVCYVLLFYVGVQMIRGEPHVTRLLVLLIVFEILYFFAVGFLWVTPNYGMSIAAATGVANGGMMFQVFCLFPMWAPIVAYVASRSLSNRTS